jgi:hypothetical protein
MRTLSTVTAAVLPIWVVACGMDGSTSIASRKIVPDPGGGVYLGNHPVTHAVFEEAIGRGVSISSPDTCALTTAVGQHGEEVHHLPEVDIACLQAEYDKGRIPRLDILPWFCQPNPSAFTVQGVIDGEIDTELRAVARAIGEWGKPVFFVYPVEPVQQWPGHGPDGQACRYGCVDEPGFQGGNCSDEVQPDPPEHYSQYGDPLKLDSVERYIDFQRHVHDTMEDEIRQLGLPSNISWVSGHAVANQDGFQYEEFWVGDQYVDWHAFGFYAGAGDCGSFPGNDAWWDEMMSMGDKPVMLTEFGVNREFFGEPFCDDRGRWLKGFFDDLMTRYPQVAALNNVELDLFPWATVIQPGDPVARAWRDELAARPERWPSCVTLGDGSEVCP